MIIWNPSKYRPNLSKFDYKQFYCYCSSNEVENEEHFVLNCSRYNTIRKSLIDYIVRNYSDFSSLDANQKIIFLFNNIDAFLCKKLGYFIYEAFALRNESTIATIVK